MYRQNFANFGGNASFQPSQVYAPRSEAELLEVLWACRGRRIRAIGRLHSWSEAPVADEVLLDLRNLSDISTRLRDGRVWVTVGAGCQIKRLLAVLNCQGQTLPTLGLITEQTIAGAISTGTHGSGRPSMSHFMEEIQIASYNPVTGEPTIRTVNSGDELRAARCSLGSLGVIVSVGFWARPQYRVEEYFRQYDSLESVLAREEDYPLQQFYLLPWPWQYMAQHRRETPHSRRGRRHFTESISFSNSISACTCRLPGGSLVSHARFVRLLFQKITPWLVIQNWNVVHDSGKTLVMEHELFRHIECELFVPRSQLPEAVELVVRLLKYFGGDRTALDQEPRQLGKSRAVERNRTWVRQLHTPLPDLHPPRAAG